MDNKKKESLVFWVIDAIALVVIICLICVFAKNIRSDKEKALPTTTAKESGKKLFDDIEITKEVVTVNTEIIEDGLREMGMLITEEYYFTQVEEYSSSKKVLIFDSTASFTYSYDGVVAAGVNCNNIVITKDDEKKTITVKMPASEIISVNIDHDSFKIYEEKEGLWNKIEMKNYNDSIKEFENAAKAKALDKGILTKADEGAQKIITSFVNSIIDNEEYTIEFTQG